MARNSFSLMLIFLLFACGGGGGSGSGGGGISYNGLQTQASVDEQNADAVAGDALEQGYGGSTMGQLAVGIGGKATHGLPPQLFLANFVRELLIGDSRLSAAAKISESYAGNCGGSATASNNSTQSSVDVEISFSAYCDDSLTINGSLSLSGTLDPFVLSATFTRFSMSNGEETFAFTGSFSFENFTSFTMSMVIQTGDATYKIEDLSISSSSGSGYTDISLSGRFYHPDYGYIDISTVTPLRYDDGDQYPSSGLLHISGTAGSMANITPLDNTRYTIDVTTANGLTYSETKSWSELGSGISVAAN